MASFTDKLDAALAAQRAAIAENCMSDHVPGITCEECGQYLPAQPATATPAQHGSDAMERMPS